MKQNVTPILKAKTLIVIKYDSFDSALYHSPSSFEAKATSVETIDSKVLNLAKQGIIWHSVSDLITDGENKVMDGINIVEYNDASTEDLAELVAELIGRFTQDITNNTVVIGYQVTTGLRSINELNSMRKKAVGLFGNTAGN